MIWEVAHLGHVCMEYTLPCLGNNKQVRPSWAVLGGGARAFGYWLVYKRDKRAHPLLQAIMVRSTIVH